MNFTDFTVLGASVKNWCTTNNNAHCRLLTDTNYA